MAERVHLRLPKQLIAQLHECAAALGIDTTEWILRAAINGLRGRVVPAAHAPKTTRAESESVALPPGLALIEAELLTRLLVAAVADYHAPCASHLAATCRRRSSR